MPTSLLPSFRRQQLVLDFSSLQYACPEGVYLSISPDKPSFWTGVLFVRDGTNFTGSYASAVLRFDISFPQSYPDLPPLVTFSTEIFHPLVVPLTTYTFSTGVPDSIGTVSASDEARLPPGALNLRHGFPHWFARGQSVRNSIGSARGLGIKIDSSAPSSPVRAGPEKKSENANATPVADSKDTTLAVLDYIKAVFEDESLLDNITLDFAGNPSAWHSWRAHRGLSKQHERGRSPVDDHTTTRPAASPRHPGQWNWDGVWESRVREGIENSTNEATLFNSTGPIRFAKLDDEHLREIQKEMFSFPTK